MIGQISLEMSRVQPVSDSAQVPGEASRLLLDNATGAVAIVQDGVMKHVNASLMKLIDYSEHELTSRPFLDFIHPDDQQMVAERYFKRLEGEEVPSAYSFRIIDKHGNARWVQLNALMLHWDGKPAVLVFLTDITEGKRAEEALLHQGRRSQPVHAH